LPTRNILTLTIIILLSKTRVNILRQNVAHVSFSHHCGTLFLLFPVYTQLIATRNRAQKLALLLLIRGWPQTGKRRFPNVL
ncbi:hypothetical protein ACS0LH_004477, partial [Escherichia coli]|uniref:hypothetical protein n=1 Tax=Escherichia coli TaxID=562 RepID=UPI0019D5E8B1